MRDIKRFERYVRDGRLFKHPSGYYCINVRNARKIVFDGYGLGIYDKTGTHCNRVTIIGGGRYVCDEQLTHQYEIATVGALARAFNSNDDLRVWLETVLQPYEIDGKRYALRVANAALSACPACAFNDKNGLCTKMDKLPSCVLELYQHNVNTISGYFQRID